MTTLSNAFTATGSDRNVDSQIGLSPFFTGSRAIIKVNDQLFGFAFSVTFNIKTDYQENRTIDQPIAVELMPTRITVDGSLSMFHIPGKGPTFQLVQSNVLSFLMHKYITIEIRDQATDKLIFKTNKAVITGRNQSVTAGEISTMSLSWSALGWVDELEQPSVPDGADGAKKIPQPGNLVGKFF